MFFSKLSIPAKITAIAALGLAAGIGLSWPLWNTGARSTFPMFPVWGGYLEKSPVPEPWPVVVLLFSALVVMIRPDEKRSLYALTGLLTALFLLDINRLQPWVWFYLLLFLAAIFGKKGVEIRTEHAFRYTLAAVYFWGGFNKLTPYFAEDNFPWFCEAFEWTKSAGRYPALGYGIALLEMSFAGGLLWKPARRPFRWIIVAFHGLIILFLWKLNWNLVVIPWNLAMAAMVGVLPVFEEKAVSHKAMPGNRLISLGAILAWFTPLLHFFHLWPHTLSWEMYTNTQPEATFYSAKGISPLTVEMDEIWTSLAFDRQTKLLLDDWSAKELHVPMFAAETTFRRAGVYLCRHTANDDSTGIYILTVHPWNRAAEKMVYLPRNELTGQ